MTMILTEVEEGFHIRVPWFQENCDATIAFPALIHVASRVIEHSQHGDDAGADTVRPPDFASLCTNVVDVQPDPPSILRYLRTFCKGIINTRDAIRVVREEKAG